MGEISTIGLDIAKSVFQVHGVDGTGAVVMRKRISRATLPPDGQAGGFVRAVRHYPADTLRLLRLPAVVRSNISPPPPAGGTTASSLDVAKDFVSLEAIQRQRFVQLRCTKIMMTHRFEDMLISKHAYQLSSRPPREERNEHCSMEYCGPELDDNARSPPALTNPLLGALLNKDGCSF